MKYEAIFKESGNRAGEMRIVSTFIKDVAPRAKDFYVKGRFVRAEMFKDNLAQAVYKAVETAYGQSSDPTPFSLATIMVVGGQLTDIPDGKTDEALALIVERLNFYANMGCKTAAEWEIAQKSFLAKYKNESALGIVQKAQEIMGKADGRTQVQKLLDLKQEIDQLLGAERIDGHSLIGKEIAGAFRTLSKEMAEWWEGRPLPRLPKHFGRLAEGVGFLMPGELSVVSAPTGVGKSIGLGQTMEWNSLCGVPSALLAFEDPKHVLLMRMAARWIPDTIYGELELLDPEDKMIKFADWLDQQWDSANSEYRIESRPGLSGDATVLLVEDILKDGINKGRPYLLLGIDYIQKIGFWQDVRDKRYQSEVLAMQYTVDRLRALAQTYNCHIMIASQVTKEWDGSLKIAWGKAVGERAQVHIQMTRENSPIDLKVYRNFKDWNGQVQKSGEMLLTAKDEPLPFVLARTEKGNRRRYSSERLFVMGASQKMTTSSMYVHLRSRPDEEFQIERFHRATAADQAIFNTVRERQDLAARQADHLWKEVEKAKEANKSKGRGKGRSEGEYMP